MQQSCNLFEWLERTMEACCWVEKWPIIWVKTISIWANLIKVDLWPKNLPQYYCIKIITISVRQKTLFAEKRNQFINRNNGKKRRTDWTVWTQNAAPLHLQLSFDYLWPTKTPASCCAEFDQISTKPSICFHHSPCSLNEKCPTRNCFVYPFLLEILILFLCRRVKNILLPTIRDYLRDKNHCLLDKLN